MTAIALVCIVQFFDLQTHDLVFHYESKDLVACKQAYDARPEDLEDDLELTYAKVEWL